MKDLLDFIKTPQISDRFKQISLKHFIKLVLVYFIFSFPFSIFIVVLRKIFPITNELAETPTITLFIMALLFAPVVEEIIFRGLLIINRKVAVLFIATTTLLIAYSLFKEKNINAAIFSFILIAFTTTLSLRGIDKINFFVTHNIKIFYFLSSFLFGLFHIFNFSGDVTTLTIFAVILTAPQIILGLILGYIRIQFGLLYSILFHFTVNGLFVLTQIHKLF